MAKRTQVVEESRFLNVDLDIYSNTDLEPLVVALGNEVYALYLGRERRRWSAHLELAEAPLGADAAIRRFTDLIFRLPPKAQKLWNSATIRDFNIGVEAGLNPQLWEIKLASRTIQRASAVKAGIVVTVYGAKQMNFSGS